jgi:hypothetical protein
MGNVLPDKAYRPTELSLHLYWFFRKNIKNFVTDMLDISTLWEIKWFINEYLHLVVYGTGSWICVFGTLWNT